MSRDQTECYQHFNLLPPGLDGVSPAVILVADFEFESYPLEIRSILFTVFQIFSQSCVEALEGFFSSLPCTLLELDEVKSQQ